MNLKTIKNSRTKEDKMLRKIQGHVGHNQKSNIYVVGIPKDREKEQDGKMCEEIMVQKFSSWRKKQSINQWIQQDQKLQAE